MAKVAVHHVATVETQLCSREEPDETRAGEGMGMEVRHKRRSPLVELRVSHMNDAFRKFYFDNLGLVSLLDRLHHIQHVSRTAVYGTVRMVVWEGGSRKTPSYPIVRLF